VGKPLTIQIVTVKIWWAMRNWIAHPTWPIS